MPGAKLCGWAGLGFGLSSTKHVTLTDPAGGGEDRQRQRCQQRGQHAVGPGGGQGRRGWGLKRRATVTPLPSLRSGWSSSASKASRVCTLPVPVGSQPPMSSTGSFQEDGKRPASQIPRSSRCHRVRMAQLPAGGGRASGGVTWAEPEAPRSPRLPYAGVGSNNKAGLPFAELAAGWEPGADAQQL